MDQAVISGGVIKIYSLYFVRTYRINVDVKRLPYFSFIYFMYIYIYIY